MTKAANRPAMRMTDDGGQGAPFGEDGSTRAEPYDPTAEAMRHVPKQGVTQVTTATSQSIVVARPRDREAVMKRICDDAAEMGDDFFYAWRQKAKEDPERKGYTRDGKKLGADGKVLIEDVSIKGALVMAIAWGNCRWPITVDAETPTHWRFLCTFLDLEDNIEAPRFFEQRKSERAGSGMADERARDMAMQIGQSKAIRNSICDGISPAIQKKAKAAARANALKQYEDLDKWRPAVVKAYKRRRVEQAHLEEKVGLPLADWEASDIRDLMLLGKAIADGETTIEEEFGIPPENAQGQAQAQGQGQPGDEKKNEPPTGAQATTQPTDTATGATGATGAPATSSTTQTAESAPVYTDPYLPPNRRGTEYNGPPNPPAGWVDPEAPKPTPAPAATATSAHPTQPARQPFTPPRGATRT